MSNSDRVVGKILRMAKDDSGKLKGFAFVRTPDGQDWFLHRSEVKNAVFDMLTEGTEIEFLPQPNAPKGPRAIDGRIR